MFGSLVYSMRIPILHSVRRHLFTAASSATADGAGASALTTSSPLSSQVYFTGYLALFTAFIYWRYNVGIRTALQKTNSNVKKTIAAGLMESKAALKSIDGSWEHDMADRKEQLRALQLQNVEQTRSVARLDGALRSCMVHPKEEK